MRTASSANQAGGIALAAAIALVIAVLFGVLAYLLARPASPPPESNVAAPSAPAPILKKIPKVTRAVPKGVQTFAPEAKARLKLPPAILAAEQEQVVAATTVRDTGRPQTVTAVLNTDTGEVQTFVKQEPLPWIAFNQRGQVRLAAGYKLDRITGVPQRVGRLSVEHDFVQAKALSMGVVASIDTDGSAFAGVGIAYRW